MPRCVPFAIAVITSALALTLQIERDGRQPRELERTRSWSYSVMNLDGWFTVARLAEEAARAAPVRNKTSERTETRVLRSPWR